ncbi:SDR family NAD(P)-dependent oxidoreductase [Sphingomonas sp. MA1305]|uniref:SDR family NAD(P)-dependent oxidoreductase n=1 Tax=Sphingomonas sp. MA1305 TaxID=2479204 RepID=UPI0018DF0998|nr:SDR family NAD(P)-dependent oxidoreductase [Sphingomonas sp. MA1305]MBI0474940.1 SDR family NAD(P)-dependent oxidoreductase [Sphingomonas sp. MA1305]
MALDRRVAIVTGAGGGLGRAHALYLASKGAQLVVNDLSEQAAAAVVDEIRAGGGTAIAAIGSVTDEQAVAAMVDTALARWGSVDILINNAGILRDKSFAKMTMADFRTVVDVHLMGAAICTKAVWEPMRSRRYGRIVMTTSSSGLYGNFGQANYGAAKMALVGLMQTLSIEGEKYGIRVNCLAPTAATQMTEGVLDEESLRMLAPDRVSPGLLRLVGDDALTRTILCAGAGHFAVAEVTLTQGAYVGHDADADVQVVRHWPTITERAGAFVPPYGFFQAEREVAAAQRDAEPVARLSA